MAKTKLDKTVHLSDKQLLALDLMLAGKTDTDISAELSISRQSIHTWKRTDFHFQAELNSRRQSLWEANAERLRGLVKKAVDVLEQDLTGEDGKLRQSAAVHILKSVGLYGVDHKPRGETDPDQLESNASSIDNILRSMGF